MDPRVEPSSEKAARAWRPMLHDPSRWAGKGLPAAVERLMTEGARIDVASEIGFFEVPQSTVPMAHRAENCRWQIRNTTLTDRARTASVTDFGGGASSQSTTPVDFPPPQIL